MAHNGRSLLNSSYLWTVARCNKTYLGSVSISLPMNLDNSCVRRIEGRSPLVCYICFLTAYTAKGVSHFYSLTRAVQSLSVEY